MLSAFLTLFIIPITGSQQHHNFVKSIADRQRENRPKYTSDFCESIVRSLPISEDYSFWDNLVLPNDPALPTPSEKIRKWLFKECMRRFAGLLYDHQNNIQRTLFEQVERRKNQISKATKNLFILGLDETVLYHQESVVLHDNPAAQIQKYNTEDLKFSFVHSQLFNRSNLIIYRQYLMNLLMDNIHNSDFVIYTMSTKGISSYLSSISLIIT